MNQKLHHIVTAEPLHALQACDVVRRSIIEVCMPLYSGNDKADRQEKWLANKTPEDVEKWIRNPKNHTFVSLDKEDERGNVTGIVMGNKDGEILLLYILPDLRSTGLGLKLYQRLEDALLEQGIRRFTLNSTIVAKQFYEARGYKPRADIENDDPLCTSMERLV